MYRDAKEELKRLEEALLQEDQAENMPWEFDVDDTDTDIPDSPKKEKRGKLIRGLTLAVIALTAVIVGLLIYIFTCHGEVFL